MSKDIEGLDCSCYSGSVPSTPFDIWVTCTIAAYGIGLVSGAFRGARRGERLRGSAMTSLQLGSFVCILTGANVVYESSISPIIGGGSAGLLMGAIKGGGMRGAGAGMGLGFGLGSILAATNRITTRCKN